MSVQSRKQRFARIFQEREAPQHSQALFLRQGTISLRVIAREVAREAGLVLPASRRQGIPKRLRGIRDWRASLCCRAALCCEAVGHETRRRETQDAHYRQQGARYADAASEMKYVSYHSLTWRRISDRFAVKLDLGRTWLQPAARALSARSVCT